MKRFASALTGLIAGLVFAGPAFAQPNTRTMAAEFYPLLTRGQLIGCQIAFSVLRLDHEFGRGNPTLVRGLLVFHGAASERPGAMLRLGARSLTASDFEPPERAYLLADMQTNARDAGQSALSDVEGFRVFPFALGQQTASAIGQFTGEGVLRFAYGPPNTSVDAVVSVDFVEYASVFADWSTCISQVVRR